MRVLVTGANGYIGRHAVTALLHRGVSVAAVDLRTDCIPTGADTYQTNIFDESIDLCHLTGYPDAVLHLAWQDGFIHQSLAHLDNLPHHFRFCQRMVKSGIKTLAVMGTIHEIGYHVGKVDENTLCYPQTLYGIAKNALRQALFASLNDTIHLMWLRAFYVYGDDKASHSVFSKLSESFERGEKLFPINSGKGKCDFLPVSMLAEQLTACVLQNKVDGIIHCCSGKPIPLAEKLKEYIDEHGWDIRLQYNIFPERSYDSPALWGDADKIKQIMEGTVKQ